MNIDSKKWSCATCIKGHRASHCQHVDRPLFEIKRKGRPSTQCKTCKELRVVRQLHVKCTCDLTGN
ncbi:copper fist DNA binding domain-containing protein [Spinellus fusiger]|nr:copper fist DNA binding domain-containing protein [Spinellus fusiger]